MAAQATAREVVWCDSLVWRSRRAHRRDVNGKGPAGARSKSEKLPDNPGNGPGPGQAAASGKGRDVATERDQSAMYGYNRRLSTAGMPCFHQHFLACFKDLAVMPLLDNVVHFASGAPFLVVAGVVVQLP